MVGCAFERTGQSACRAGYTVHRNHKWLSRMSPMKSKFDLPICSYDETSNPDRSKHSCPLYIDVHHTDRQGEARERSFRQACPEQANRRSRVPQRKPQRSSHRMRRSGRTAVKHTPARSQQGTSWPSGFGALSASEGSWVRVPVRCFHFPFGRKNGFRREQQPKKKKRASLGIEPTTFRSADGGVYRCATETPGGSTDANNVNIRFARRFFFKKGP